MGWTIRQTSEKTGISEDTLRYYDKENIISPKRGENGYRLYDDNDISNLKNIVIMKYAHFTLAEIKRMEERFGLDPNADCNEICRGILSSKVTELRRAICNYQQIVELLETCCPWWMASMPTGIIKRSGCYPQRRRKLYH